MLRDNQTLKLQPVGNDGKKVSFRLETSDFILCIDTGKELTPDLVNTIVNDLQEWYKNLMFPLRYGNPAGKLTRLR